MANDKDLHVIERDEAKARMLLEMAERRREKERRARAVERDYANYIQLIKKSRENGAWKRRKPKGVK